MRKLSGKHSMEYQNRKYYEAYEERYKQIHGLGYAWAGNERTGLIEELFVRFGVSKNQKLLEIGCGEGRDAFYLLDQGYDLLATDVSSEAISYCKKMRPDLAEHFFALDCVRETLSSSFDLIYAVAVLHMLTEDEDRRAFYDFIRKHLKKNGKAMIFTMGDGEHEYISDSEKAFELTEREHASGKVMVASSSCRMVSFAHFQKELKEAGFTILEEGITSCLPHFDRLLYAVVEKSASDGII